MNKVFNRVLYGRAIIAACVSLACGTSYAALGNTDDLTPAGAPMPTFSLESSTDFDSLRDAWGRRMDYGALCEASLPTKPWAEADRAGDTTKAYDILIRWLASCPVVERVHVWAYMDAKKMGDAKRMDMHLRWYRGLIESVLKTGDGKTPETAWKTISIGEEYAVLRYLGLAPTRQALVKGNIDMLSARPASGGQNVDLYFDPAWHFARMQRDFLPTTPAEAPAK